jgi:hypothetical protein
MVNIECAKMSKTKYWLLRESIIGNLLNTHSNRLPKHLREKSHTKLI